MTASISMVPKKPDAHYPGIIWLMAALVALLLAIVLRWCRFPLPVLKRVAVRLRPAPKKGRRGKVERAVNAVRWVAKYTPVRAACVEVSLAVLLLGMALRHSTVLCIGARFAPLETHAWVEVEGLPVAEAWHNSDRPYQTVATL